MGRRRMGWLLLGMLLFPWAVSLGWMRYVGAEPGMERAEVESAGGLSGPDEAAEPGGSDGAADAGERGGAAEAAVPRTRRICMERNGVSTYLELEDYLPGVVACQIPEGKEGEYSPETWRCQAVIARTYICRLMGSREEILEQELDLDYLGDYVRGIFANREAAVARLELAEAACRDTWGAVMKYGGDYILPLFHEESAGRTRPGAEQFPYLQPVDSGYGSGESPAREYQWDAGEFARRIGQIPGAEVPDPGQLSGQIQTLEKDSSGYLLKIQIGAKAYSGDEVQAALGLPSPYFRLEADNNTVRAVARGRGHGYGLSQNGADRMAKEGWGYEDILFYYFKDIDLIFE